MKKYITKRGYIICRWHPITERIEYAHNDWGGIVWFFNLKPNDVNIFRDYHLAINTISKSKRKRSKYHYFVTKCFYKESSFEKPILSKRKISYYEKRHAILHKL